MEPFTTYQISKMLNVDITTVIDWIDKGLLNAYRTPGGHRRIQVKGFIDFLKKYKMPIPDDIIEQLRPGPSRKKILIVDDDEGVLEFISQVIEKYFSNVKIKTAKDGFTAGEEIIGFKPDLLILDIKLPGIDGFEILQHLKKEKIKIIAITADLSKEIREKIIKSDADDYLIKPFTIKELKQKIENLLKL